MLLSLTTSQKLIVAIVADVVDQHDLLQQVLAYAAVVFLQQQPQSWMQLATSTDRGDVVVLHDK